MLNNSAYLKAVKTARALPYSLRVRARAPRLCARLMAVVHSPSIRAAPDVSGDIMNTQAHRHAELCAQKPNHPQHAHVHTDAAYQQSLTVISH